MRNLEFHNTPQGEVLVVRDGKSIVLDLSQGDLVDALWAVINTRYPKATNALLDVYKDSLTNKNFHRFRIVRRFIKCNFCGCDNKVDLESPDKINLEYVPCPLKGAGASKDCFYENVICNPEFFSGLSKREKEIMKLYCDGKSAAYISNTLFISPRTTETHKRNALNKTGCHSMVEFMNYSKSNKLFE